MARQNTKRITKLLRWLYNHPKIPIRDEPHTYTNWKAKAHKINIGETYMIQDQTPNPTMINHMSLIDKLTRKYINMYQHMTIYSM